MPQPITHLGYVDMTMFENHGNLQDFQTSTECYVKLNMGPYEANGIIRHRIQRLKGLQDFLSKSGYNVELAYTPHLERFTMDFYEREIFRCNIKNFQFNLPAEEDPLCTRAIKILQEHEARFFQDTNIPKFVDIHHGMRFLELNKLYTTADQFFCSNVELLFEIKQQVEAKESKTPEKKSSSESSDDFKSLGQISEAAIDPNEMTEIPLERLHDKVKISIEAHLTKERERQKEMLLAELDEVEETDYIDVLDRASKNVRMRRASLMFRSDEIQPMQVASNLGSLTFMDRVKPEIRNQKIISKVKKYRAELKKMAKKQVVSPPKV